jgi:hypothetical protein
VITGKRSEPYVGLRSFEEGDRERFFGRSRETWQLASLMLTTRLVVAYGPAGVGKTSLVQAGVLARLRDGAQPLPVGCLPRASALADELFDSTDENPYTLSLLCSWAPDRAPASLRGTTLDEFLAAVPVEVDRYGDPRPLVAIVDQFEEALGDGPQGGAAREELIEQLSRALRTVDRLHVLLVTKQEALGHLIAVEPSLFPGIRRRFQVGALDREAAREAVTAPLDRTSRSYAPDAADDLVDRLCVTTFTDAVGEERTVADDSVEPISLQVVCLALWRSLPDDVTVITADITGRHLQEPGDVQATLTTVCAGAVMDIAHRERLPERALWDWLDRTFITDLGTRSTAHRGISATGGMPNSVAHAFEDCRVLRSETRLGSVWFELLHDVLVQPIRYGKDLSQGIAAGIEAPELAPEIGPGAYLRMARSALRYGRPALAREYAKGAVRTSEHDARAHADAHAFVGDLVFEMACAATGPLADELFESAEDNLRRAAQLFEAEHDLRASGRLLAQLGRLSMARGRYAEALEWLRSAVQRTRGDMEIRLAFARALSETGQSGAAVGAYTVVLDAAARTVEALVERGILSAHHGDADSALRDLDAAVGLQPDLADRPDVAAARAAAESRRS